ncbi:mannosyl-oligosaccharide alpha-1,3 glucosidase [Acrasis kona]|uniref:Glucosidase II subunit alpha n=1 Tax=Acrasis kona TaxID=1008807 RepID=A0AAW2ZDH1_9EUKA
MRLVLVLLLAVIALAMEHHKFEKCEQKSFCKRLREAKQSHYVVSSVAKEGNSVNIELVDDSNKFNDPLSATVEAYEHGILRFTIQEKTESSVQILKKRYSVQDVIIDSAKKGELSLEGDVISTGKSRLVIDKGSKTGTPFRFTFYAGDQEAIVINSDNLLTLESTLRSKEEEPAPQEPVQEGQEPPAPVERYQGESAIGIDFTFPGAQHVFGIPERATDLALKPTKGDGVASEPYRMYNLDVFEYELDNPIGLYGIIPLLYSLKAGFSAGVFYLNPSETFVDVYDKDAASSSMISLFKSKEKASHWISETGLIDVLLLPGPNPKSIVAQMGYLTGNPPLPQKFSLGYHQCRWNYKDEEDVRNVDAKFDEYNIPYDVIWLDIEHTDDKKYFTWDAHNFPTSEAMQLNVASKGRKMVTITDPHIKRHSGYHVHDEAARHGYYVKTPSGSDYEGSCWPGQSSWLDYFNPVVRDFYAKQFHYDNYKGSTKYLYTWIDMNEPSVFSGPEVTMHKDSLHHQGIQHYQVHNMYGFYQGMATYQGHLSRNEGKDRPFILSRSFFAGSQRYVAVWTGDNKASWDHLVKSTPMILSMGMAGFPHIGADVGGFFGNPDAELLVRWYQAGAFSPFFRGHAHIETQRREPWLFGEENTNYIREAISFRYTLLNHYYTLAKHSSLTSLPIMRPLLMNYPEDASTFDVQDEFMVGGDLLVKPVTAAGCANVNVLLPKKDVWYDYHEATRYDNSISTHARIETPMNKIPVLQRGGSIISTQQRLRRSSTQMKNDPFTLQIALSANLTASGDLYFDDGANYDYKNGDYVYRRFVFQNGRLTNELGDLSDVALSNGVIGNETHVAQNVHYAESVVNVVERVVVIGVDKEPSDVQLIRLSGVNSVLPDAIGTSTVLDFDYDSKVKKLVIRKPNVKITQKWSIQIK